MFKTESLKTSFLKRITGLKVGNELTEIGSKIFKENYELSRNLKIELEKAKKFKSEVSIKIEEINEREIADLDQDLFDKVFGKNSVKSVTEMKNKLSEDFVKQFQNQVNQKLMNDTIEYLIESTKINLPSEFLIKWMKLSSENKISIDEAKSEYEKSEKGMKYQLIESKIIIDNDLQVNFEDLKSFTTDLIKNQMLQYGQAITDEKEGADIIMVKPAMIYLDVVREVSNSVMRPVAVYNVSGEYSLVLASKPSVEERKKMVCEILHAFKRAGADVIVSYHTREVINNKWLN